MKRSTLLSLILLAQAYLLKMAVLDMCNGMWNAKVVKGGEEGTVSGVETVILASSGISFGLSL